jgi:FAD/FMN-containing dehydrogenase
MLNAATPEFEDLLRGLLDAAAFRPDSAPYFNEPRGRWQGHGLVVAPADTAAIAAVVTACAQARVAIVPYSGGTGLVGGQVMPDGPAPVVLSLERLNKIRAVYPSENVLVCEAGVILAHVQQAAEDAGRLFPLSLASEGSARIGGLLATNAGGVNVLRYGNARALCLGLEVVRPDGTIWHGLTRLRKDNSGYDLRNLMIGAEGTLGIITAAALRLVPRPVHLGAALLAVPSPQAALDLLAMAGAQIGDGLSAFELMHRQGFDFLAEVGPDVRQPFDAAPEWSVLIDLGLPASGNPDAALERLFADAFDAGLALDGVIAQSAAQRKALWAIRENIPEANRRIGSIASHDIALPLSAVPSFIAQASDAVQALSDMRINCFGHLGDGNLHYNVFPAEGRMRMDYDAIRPAIQQTIHDLVAALDGSVSAEHGIGRAKVDDLQHYGDAAKLAMLRAIKDALDPEGIMNPGVILPEG